MTISALILKRWRFIAAPPLQPTSSSSSGDRNAHLLILLTQLDQRCCWFRRRLEAVISITSCDEERRWPRPHRLHALQLTRFLPSSSWPGGDEQPGGTFWLDRSGRDGEAPVPNKAEPGPWLLASSSIWKSCETSEQNPRIIHEAANSRRPQVGGASDSISFLSACSPTSVYQP